MKIKLTEFSKTRFDRKSSGTKILDMTADKFESALGTVVNTGNPNWCLANDFGLINRWLEHNGRKWIVLEGYAPFCKLLAIENFTDARVGTTQITLENYQYLRSGYSARNENELPVLSRWLELPLGKPVAPWLVVVLYSKEQIDFESNKEHLANMEIWEDDLTRLDKPIKPEPFEGDYGIITVLGQNDYKEEPMQPMTMIRNSYMHGGSHVKFKEKDYNKSVKFWSENAIIK